MSGNFVYVICYRERDHKIGFSARPAERFSALRSQTLAARVVKTWHRPEGDAQRVEGIAHRLLREWRLPIPRQIERFGLSEMAACMAVELAVRIAEDEAHPRPMARRPEAPPMPRPQPPAQPVPASYGPPPPVRIGYALCLDASEAEASRAGLIAAGAEPGRIYLDLGRRRGPAYRAARKACRPGDILIVGRPGIDKALLAAMGQKQAICVEVTP